MRRVITGFDKNGKSTVVYDGPPGSIHHVSGTQVGSMKVDHVAKFIDPVQPRDACVADLWETTALPTPGDADRVAQPQGFTIDPPGKGMRIRYSVWGPHLDSSTMHKTDTLDVNYILEGEVTLLLEENRSVVLAAGDTVILPAVVHGWRAGPNGVKMLMIMQRMA